MTVINLDDHRPHKSGTAKCIHCKHEWEAVAPADLSTFECPSCGLGKGVWYGICIPHEDEYIFQCKCGCDLFMVMQAGPHCVACGNVASWDDVL